MAEVPSPTNGISGGANSSEAPIYERGEIRITRTLAVLGGKTYAMSNVTSVSLGEIPANTTTGYYLILFGIALASAGFLTGANSSSTLWCGFIILAVLLIAGGVSMLRNAKPSYTVKLASASGETQAYASPDKESVKNIVDAITTAIVSRG